MAVNVGQRNVKETPSNSQCYAVDACYSLLIHTLKITANGGIFTPEHSDLTAYIRSLTAGIYTCAFTANKIRVTTPKGYTKRTENQESSITGLTELLGLIPVARALFHLRGKKVQYWVKLTKEALDLVVRWHDSDVERYSDFCPNNSSGCRL